MSKLQGKHCQIWNTLRILVMAVVLTACGVKLPWVTEDQQIIVLWHNFSGTEADAFQALVDRYNADHVPNVVLIAEYQNDIAGKLRTATGAARPDVVTLTPKDLPVYQALGLLTASPTDSPAILRSQTDVLPMATALYTFNGQQVAVPLGLATYLLYYNAEWTSDLGYAADTATHEDLRRTTCAATDPLTGQTGIGIPAQAGMMLAFLAAGGSEIIGQDGYYHFSDEMGIAYTQTLHDILRGDCGYVYGDWSAGLSRLSRSSMAMAVASSKMLTEIETEVATGRNFRLQISSIPGISGKGVTLWYGPGMLVVSEDKAQQSLDVLDYFISTESQAMWADKTTYLPIRQSLLETFVDEEIEFPTLEMDLAQIALTAANDQTWQVWSPYNDHMACRGALLRTLLKLEEENAVPEQYIDAAVTACNTAIRFPVLPESTPASEENTQP